MILLALILSLTNTAGRVVSAEPLAITGSVVTVRMSGAAVVRQLPLSLFPAGEQARLRASLGSYELPADLAEVRRIFAADLARAEARTRSGAMSEEELVGKRKRVQAGWERCLAKPKYALSDEERTYWKGHLR